MRALSAIALLLSIAAPAAAQSSAGLLVDGPPELTASLQRALTDAVSARGWRLVPATPPHDGSELALEQARVGAGVDVLVSVEVAAEGAVVRATVRLVTADGVRGETVETDSAHLDARVIEAWTRLGGGRAPTPEPTTSEPPGSSTPFWVASRRAAPPASPSLASTSVAAATSRPAEHDERPAGSRYEMARGPDSGWIAAGLVIFSLGYVVSSGVAAAGLLAMQGPYPDPSVHCRNEMGGLSLIPLVGQLAGALHLDQCLPRGWGGGATYIIIAIPATAAQALGLGFVIGGIAANVETGALREVGWRFVPAAPGADVGASVQASF